jgi:hypothetical protein
MHTIGMLLLAAATAGDGFGYDKPGVHLKKWLRPHAVVSDGAPPGGPQYTAATMGGGGGAGMDGGAGGRRFVNTKSQIYFLDPDGMTVAWQTGTGPSGERTYTGTQLVVPARYNFNQGYIYRLRLTNIPGRRGVTLYPSIEVAPTTPATDAYLAHNAIPVQFTAEDFDQVVEGGNFVTKVIYLPDPKYQELAVSGVETLVSTRLEPGIDPILEADKRGTILLIVRLGAIDLEMQDAAVVSGPVVGVPVDAGVASPAPAAGAVPAPAAGAAAVPAPVVMPPTVVPPGALPPGVTPTPPAPVESVPVDTAPAVSPAPAAPKPNVLIPAVPRPAVPTPVPPAPR